MGQLNTTRHFAVTVTLDDTADVAVLSCDTYVEWYEVTSVSK